MYMPNYHLSKDGYDELPEVLAARGFKKVALIGGERAKYTEED